MKLLDKVKKGRVARAQKIVIYAPEGFGKSTIASQFPDPLFLDLEGGTSQMDVPRLTRDELPDLRTVEKAILEIARERAAGTVIIDTVDWLEQVAVDALVREAASDKIQGIEDFGYGKGYTALRERLTILLAHLDALIAEGINVVLLAHSQVKKFEPPDGAGAFDRYELKLTKQVAPLVKEWADMVIFGNYRTQISEKGKGEATKYKGVGGRERQMHCNRCAAWDAKNRHALADVEKWDIATIAKGFANVGAPWGMAAGPAAAPAPVTAPPAPKTPETAAAAPVQAPAALPPEEDPIPGLAPEEQPDAELDALLAPHAAAVNAFLRQKREITERQTYRSVSPSYRARILKNPAGFMAVAGKAVAA